jgi:hypothetical protein
MGMTKSPEHPVRSPLPRVPVGRSAVLAALQADLGRPAPAPVREQVPQSRPVEAERPFSAD